MHNINWSKSKKLNLVIDIHSLIWLKEHADEIEDWLESEDILKYNNIRKFMNNKFCVFLYSNEQMTYFTLRWS